MCIKKCLCNLNCLLVKLIDAFTPIILILARFEIFCVFFKSGMVKVKDFNTTKFLFENEYQTTWLPLPPNIVEYFQLNIPKMQPVLAAYTGTFVELFFPVLVLLGLGGRIPLLILFIFNYIAAVSYPFLWTKVGMVGLQNHYFWGAVLLMLVLQGSGKYSLDNFFCKRKCKNNIV